ncbi:aspartate carbamoyltransferase [Amorphus orientalis]|uniref:Aspartate carbamoyltransferase n=1 Tax=Amorphus orientalis TaxID=649198 RepID=A0AAE3VPL1_9HYPH|nr:aspartate carbamoyltransferase [Amorphus orientalis]MDQ0315947.1 aspartate carbamoyltransferase catalytic subunit [Amorphus orientalis]
MLDLGYDVLSARQFDRDDLTRLTKVAEALEPVARGEVVCRALEGAVMANLFFEPSTRTRISFGTAFSRLGGTVLDTSGLETTAIVKGESLYDTARVVSGYADVIVVRHPTPEAARIIAGGALVPVINGGDGEAEHPTQALTDFFTISKELKASGRTIDGATIVILGDLRYGRTTHSLIALMSVFEGLTFHLVSPEALSMPDQYADIARNRGHQVKVFRTLDEGLAGADVVYATRYQSERFQIDPQVREAAERLRLDAASFRRHAPEHAVILHPLPRDEVFGELSTDLDGLPNLAIFRQTDNGVPVRMALFALILGVADTLTDHFREPTWPLRRRRANP